MKEARYLNGNCKETWNAWNKILQNYTMLNESKLQDIRSTLKIIKLRAKHLNGNDLQWKEMNKMSNVN